jgi:hypothetical protein
MRQMTGGEARTRLMEVATPLTLRGDSVAALLFPATDVAGLPFPDRNGRP